MRDIFAVSSADYRPKSDIAKTFFATIQNKLIYAVTGRTAAELVLERCDSASPTMGLTTWKGARVRRGDVGIAKNYLTGKELAELNLLTTMFLDFAEDRAKRRQQTLMADWVEQTDRFLDFNERDVLEDAGAVSADDVELIVTERYAEFDGRRRAADAEQAAAEEDEDLAELIDIERRNKGTIEDGQ